MQYRHIDTFYFIYTSKNNSSLHWNNLLLIFILASILTNILRNAFITFGPIWKILKRVGYTFQMQLLISIFCF